MPAYRSVGIYTCCSAAGPANDTSNFVGDWIRSEEVDFLVGVGIHSRPSHDPLVRVPLSGKRRRRSCKGIRLRIRNDKILTKRVSPSASLSLQYFSGIIFVHRNKPLSRRNERGRNVEVPVVRRRGVLGKEGERNDPRNSMVENKPNWRTFACFALGGRHGTWVPPSKCIFDGCLTSF